MLRLPWGVYVGVMLLVFVVMISGLIVNSVDIYRFFGIWFLFVCCIVVIVLVWFF